ncbi:short-chain dehydrogenase/reductase SDR [Zopfochytrium polystomum]|nr:short-chain dehydrogenase/reductase SDR [Zopfochytrium polystomum]
MASSTPVIVVAGYGPGISRAVAIRFAKDKGLAVALLARTESKLHDAEKELAAQGVTAKGFPVDFSDVDATRRAIASVRATLGPIQILFWNATSSGNSSTLLDPASANTLLFSYNVNVGSLVAAVRDSLDDLKASHGAVLVTGGGLELDLTATAKLAVAWKASSTAALMAAKRKTVQLLHEELNGVGVFAGEVTVMGAVKGTPYDDGTATIEASGVADKFVRLLEARAAVFDAIA